LISQWLPFKVRLLDSFLFIFFRLDLEWENWVSIWKMVRFVEEEREMQKNYWIEHSADLTVEAMMLDSKASDLDKEERPEVKFLSLLSLS
jgi:hypothetical protein